MSDSRYHAGSRELQDTFDSRRMADRMSSSIQARIKDEQREFIERCDMLFIATADADGRPQCNYKGGDPGFVRVIDEETIAYPDYNGNGMFLTLGNTLVNPHVGLLFINFEERRRLRLNGAATLDRHDPLLAEYPGGSWSSACMSSRSFRTARATSTTTGSSNARASYRRRIARRPCRGGRRSRSPPMTCPPPIRRATPIAK